MKRLWALAGLVVGVPLGFVGAVIAGFVAGKTVGRVEVAFGDKDFEGEPCRSLGCAPRPHAHLKAVGR